MIPYTQHILFYDGSNSFNLLRAKINEKSE